MVTSIFFVKRSFYLLSFILIALISCRNLTEKDLNVHKKDSLLINSYHKEAIKIRGENEFFISKEDFNAIVRNFFETEIRDYNNIMKNDNVFFIDTIGNVQYQSIVYEVKNDSILIECEELYTGKKYITHFDIKNIKDLNYAYPYIIKIYRSKKLN